MKSFKSYLILFLILLLISCNSKEQKKSKSFEGIKVFLTEAKIGNSENIYFYEDKPRMPLPNVYCFDSTGVQINTPPGCFSVIKDYIVFLGDSIIPAKKDGQMLGHFLDSIHIMDAYDNRVEFDELRTQYDYYLFVDFIALPMPDFQNILFDAVKYSKESKKKIKLFLVHAISEKNKKYFAQKGKNDTVNAQAIRDSLLR